jgi:sulfide:quinone oxidoreductase
MYIVICHLQPVDRSNMKTSYPNVYAIGDVTRAGTPKSGLFAQSAARCAAENILAEFKGFESPAPHEGKGSCYVEFGEGKIARSDVDFYSNATPTGIHFDASSALAGRRNRSRKII